MDIYKWAVRTDTKKTIPSPYKCSISHVPNRKKKNKNAAIGLNGKLKTVLFITCLSTRDDDVN